MTETEQAVYQSGVTGRTPSERTAKAPVGLPAASNEGQIELHGVARAYRTASGTFYALNGVDLRIEPGEFACVIGRSGSGKSTLLHLIAGLDTATAGVVRVAGVELTRLDEAARAHFRRRAIGVVFQFFQLLPTLSALENITLALDLGGVFPKHEHKARARQLLADFSVADQAEKLPTALSGGQQQRVAIARALANDPAIVVCDEPTGNLDSRSADAVLTLLSRVAEAGTTVLTVTHERQFERYFSRVIELSDGRVTRNEHLEQRRGASC